jgi:hypothetical protein
MRYRLRTLLILLAVGPPVLAWWAWPAAQARYDAWRWKEAVERAKIVRTRGGLRTMVDFHAPMAQEMAGGVRVDAGDDRLKQ